MPQFPDFYNPQRIGTLFYPGISAISHAAVAANLSPTSTDSPRLHLLLVDMQIDFCHKNGMLYVPGAEGDIRRTIEFIYRNAAQISQITCTLDSHKPFQIFHPPWWIDNDGNHPKPYTIISVDEVSSGKWRPLYSEEWSIHYVQELEETAKKQLVIWPFHVQISALGHSLDPELWSAVFWHSLARHSQPTMLQKGFIEETEHYSIVRPEIIPPGKTALATNEHILTALRDGDYLYIAGEAETHCVLETVEDIVEEFNDQPDIVRRIFVLEDCMSPVIHPYIDFHALALEQFKYYAKAGVNFVTSEDPIPF